MPFVATSPEQIQVGDEVEANNEDGEIVRGTVLKIEMRPGPVRALIHFSKKHRVWYFDPSSPSLFGFERTWTVLSRDLEPERPEIRVGDRVAIVDRREGIVEKVWDSAYGRAIRFQGGHDVDHLLKRQDYEPWTRTVEVLERAPEPLTPEQKLEKITALLEEDSEGTDAGISCAGYKVTDTGCYVSTLAAKITAILGES